MQLVRDFFGVIPKGAKFFVSTLETPTGGADPEFARECIAEIHRELREASRDPAVTNITVLLMFDGPEDGPGKAGRAQLLLPLGTQP